MKFCTLNICNCFLYRCNTNHSDYSNITFAPYNSTSKDAACDVPIYVYNNGTAGNDSRSCKHFNYSKEYFQATIVTEVCVLVFNVPLKLFLTEK